MKTYGKEKFRFLGARILGAGARISGAARSSGVRDGWVVGG